MIKYVDYDIVFQEVPGEVSLALNISNCPNRCPGCHSPHLQEDIGRDLEEDLPELLKKYAGMITCVLFLGTGNDPVTFRSIVSRIVVVNKLKTAVYSGMDLPDSKLALLEYADYVGFPDYIKVGSYKAELGGLSSPATNQRMYKWNHKKCFHEDITHLFRKNEV